MKLIDYAFILCVANLVKPGCVQTWTILFFFALVVIQFLITCLKALSE